MYRISRFGALLLILFIGSIYLKRYNIQDYYVNSIAVRSQQCGELINKYVKFKIYTAVLFGSVFAAENEYTILVGNEKKLLIKNGYSAFLGDNKNISGKINVCNSNNDFVAFILFLYLITFILLNATFTVEAVVLIVFLINLPFVISGSSAYYTLLNLGLYIQLLILTAKQIYLASKK